MLCCHLQCREKTCLCLMLCWMLHTFYKLEKPTGHLLKVKVSSHERSLK